MKLPLSFIALIYVKYFFMLASLAVGIWKRKTLTGSFRIVYGLVWVRVISEIVSTTLAAFYIQNHFVLNIQEVVEFVIICWFYHQLIKDDGIRRGILTIMLLIVAFALFRFFNIDEFLRFNNYVFSISSLVLIGLVLLFLYQLVHQVHTTNLLTDSSFWFSAGILLYYSGNFFVFLFGEQILFSQQVPKVSLWQINLVACVIYHLCLSIGFLLSKLAMTKAQLTSDRLS